MPLRIRDYEITEKLAENTSTLVCRGRQTENGESVILKILKTDVATRDEVVRFRHEYEITSNFHLSGVVKVLALEEYKSELMMRMEDIGGQSLDRILIQASLSLIESLELAISLADTVGFVHKQHVIHKNINPSNIVYNSNTKQINLIGFGLADEIPEYSVAPQPPSALEGTLEYISPEQTGRMNRTVDYRTDFYSLGVTLYQMLTGRLPFQAADPLEWIHCHIAGIPTAPHTVLPEIPEMISLIVMKLMAKMADERYQSAFGLKADLEKCLQGLITTGSIQHFELGLEDFSDQLRVIRKLYGREKEIKQLLEAFDRVTAGTPGIFLVAGYAGTGKTALVREIYPSVAEKRGHFIVGKFEQLQRNVPYFAWIQAFERLVNDLLMESEAELNQWKQAIQKAVGNIGKVLTDVIPNLELIIGPQPVIPELGDVETQNRFNYVFLRFVKAIATKDRPLVVFLDDLQWIEAASLKLFETLMTGSGILNVLLIGAYRDNEVDASHPLMMSIDKLRKENENIELLTLKDLSEQSVNELIADSLCLAYSKTVPLSHKIYSKSSGNPFFLLQTLKSLTDEHAISFNAEHRTWQWDTQAIEKMDVTDNVVTLMADKIQQLPSKTRHLLPLAACIGFTFNLPNLSAIAKESEDDTLKAIQPAIHEGLITADVEQYQFAHDRVQQAAYTLIPVEKRPERHLKIGRILLEKTPENRLTDNIFEIVNHLNRGMSLLNETKEQKRLAELNLIAGRRARTAPAFALAASYFEAGLAALGPRFWEENYNLGFSLKTELAECEYMIGKFDHSLELLSEALGHARSLLDQAWVYRLYQRAYQVSGHWPESVSATLQGLALFGISFPKDEKEICRATESENRKIKMKLSGLRIADLVDMPFTDDPEVQTLLAMLSEALSLIYITQPILWPLIMARTVNLCLEKGHVEEAPNIYSGYSMMLAGLYDDIDAAFQFSQMSLNLNERIPGGSALKGRIQFFHSAVVSIWRQHFRMSLPLLEQAFLDCIDSGDLLWASYITYHAIWLHWEIGTPLGQVTEIARHYERFNQENKYDAIYSVNRIQEQFALCLAGKTRSLTDFGDDTFDEAAGAAANIEAGFDVGIAYYYIMKQIAVFHAGCFDEASRWAEQAEKVLPSVSSMAIWAAYYFYYALTLTALYGQVDTEQQREFMGILADIQEKQKRWADNCPENFANRVALVDAEIARVEGRDSDAMRLYEEAIVSAKANGFIQYEAMANEAAACFYESRGIETATGAYFRQARDCYVRWGANAKVKQLEALHPRLVEKASVERGGIATRTEQLDTMAIIKAQHAISSKISLEQLTETLLRIVMESAGAQTGFLSVEGSGRLRAKMQSDENGNQQIVFDPSPALENIPKSIINYVRRSRDVVILDEAGVRTGAFAADDYLRRVKPKSVLSISIQRQNKLLGVLYLENNLIGGAFTPERIVVIEALAAQTAISLENAGVYEALKESEKQLRENEERIQLALGGANIGLLDYNIQNNTLIVDDRWLEMLGYSPDEIEIDAETWWSWIHPEDQARQAKAFQDHIEGRSPYYHLDEYRVRSKSGDWVWLLDHGKVVEYDTDGRPLRLVGIHQDISERIKAEEEIAWNLTINQTLASLYIPIVTTGTSIEQIADIVLEGSRQLTSSAHGYVGEIDPATRDLIAHTNTKMLQTECIIAEKELRKIRFPQRPDGLYNGLWGHALNTKEPFYTNDAMKHPASAGIPEGHLVIERFLTVPVLLAGELVGQIALSNSVRAYTDRDLDAVNRIADFFALAIQHKRAEEEIRALNRELEERVSRRTSQLEAANRELEAFAYSVSHDLRAPLRGIDGFSQILLEEYRDKVDEQGRECLQRVRAATERMSQLIDDMLNLSRVSRGDMTIEQVDLSDMAREIAEDLRNSQPGRQVEFLIHDGLEAWGDGRLLRIVLENLIGNAWKFTSKHSSARIEFGMQQQNGTSVYFVRDNGVGFEMNYARKMFDAFQRLHTADEFPGTGIGLATVQRIIHRHGGKVWAEGELGKGATVYFTI